MHPEPTDADVTYEAMFLRDIAAMLSGFLYGDATPTPLTVAEREAAQAAKGSGADLMTPEQAIERLNLPTRRKEVSDGR